MLQKLNLSYIVFCWQDDSPDNAYYLDRKTGDVKLVNRHLFDLRQLTDEIEKDRERYLYLPKPERKTLIDDLHDFAKTVDNEKTRRILDVAFESPHVLSAFRKILDAEPGAVQRLQDFLEERTLTRVEAWLKANAVAKEWEIDEDDLDLEEEDDYELEDFSV